jgi:hypothetical protein
MWNNFFMIILGIAVAAVLIFGAIGAAYIVYLIIAWIAERIRK